MIEDKRTLAYIRVSTERQELGRQRDMIQRWAVAFEVKIDNWLEDDGISGRAAAVKGARKKSGADMNYYANLCQDNFLASVERPGFLAMLQAVKDGDYKRVVVAALDRLSRDTMELMLLESKLHQWGCELVSVDSGQILNTEDAGGWLQFAMKAIFAEYECRQTGDRTRQGIAARRAAGVRLGRPPAGWMKSEDGEGFVPDPEKWPTMLAAVAARESGATLEEIAAEVPGINNKPAAARWLKSWENRNAEGFKAPPEMCHLAPMAEQAKTENARFPLLQGKTKGEK